ncbi:hypothetical protein ACOSQ4_021160 [Xanthoceras sorbifolium]
MTLEHERLPRSVIFSQTMNNGSESYVVQLKGNICPSHTIFMPSSISSLVSLHLYDQYFLASSTEGLECKEERRK